MPNSFHVLTFGCQQNEADSERLGGMLCAMGYERSDAPENSDIIILNTCAVREHAELKALSIAGQQGKLKEQNPNLIIGVCGCMVNQKSRAEQIKNSYPYIDFILGTADIHRLPEVISSILSARQSGKRRRELDVSDAAHGKVVEGLPTRREDSRRAWVSIMYGCDNFCTYCIVPYVRGRERSRERAAIIAEVRELAEKGYRDITLLGQNVNSYAHGFPTLLSELCGIEGDFKLRFMTSHPKDATRELIDVIAANPKIARHFHLPLQSGSDRILAAMNRRYTPGKYMDLIGYMREKIPDIAVTTDIIVGFPGETEEDFEQTLAALRRAEYDNIYSFIFSPRKGTPAAALPEQLSHGVKTERFSRLLAVQDEISARKNAALVGRSVEALIESPSKTDPSKLTARTDGNKLIHFTGDKNLIGERRIFVITEAGTHSLTGELA